MCIIASIYYSPHHYSEAFYAFFCVSCITVVQSARGFCCVHGYSSSSLFIKHHFFTPRMFTEKLSPLWAIRAGFERFGRAQPCCTGGEVGQNKMLLHADSHSANKYLVRHVKNIAPLMGSPIYTPNSLHVMGRVRERGPGCTWPVAWYFYQDFHFRCRKRWWWETHSVGPNPL